MENHTLVDPRGKLIFDDKGQMTGIYREQDITDDFLDMTHEMRMQSEASKNSATKDKGEAIAVIPVEVLEFLYAIGFDPGKEGARKTIALLRHLDLQKFITTAKEW